MANIRILVVLSYFTGDNDAPVRYCIWEDQHDKPVASGSFKDLVHVPAKKRSTSQRKKLKNYNLTSDEHVAYISEVLRKKEIVSIQQAKT